MKVFAIVAAVATLSLTSARHASAEDTGLAIEHDVDRANGRLCMTNHGHSGSGPGATKPAARAAAIASWIDFTNFEYGRLWASFSASAGQSTRYTKEASGWSATVDARPCRR